MTTEFSQAFDAMIAANADPAVAATLVATAKDVATRRRTALRSMESAIETARAEADAADATHDAATARMAALESTPSVDQPHPPGLDDTQRITESPHT